MTSRTARPATATWYRAYCGWHTPEIKAFPIVSFTDKTVVKLEEPWSPSGVPRSPRETREARDSHDYHWDPAFDEAKIWLVATCEEKVKQAKDQLQKERSSLRQAQSLKESS
jgi:hypothetical protein